MFVYEGGKYVSNEQPPLPAAPSTPMQTSTDSLGSATAEANINPSDTADAELSNGARPVPASAATFAAVLIAAIALAWSS